MARATPPKRHRGTPEITVYGRRAVLEALGAPSVRVSELRVAKETPGEFRKDLRAAVARSANADLQISTVSLNDVFALSRDKRNDQGVAARITLSNIIDLEELALMGKGRNARTPTRVLAFDGLTNPQNIGMSVRSACAAGFDAVLWPAQGCPWINGLIIKASASSVYAMPIATCDTLEGAIDELKAQGFEVAALDMHGQTSLFDFAPPHRLIAVVGSETKGVSDETRARADTTLTIPMSDRVESLNASVAASLVCFAIANSARP